MQEQEAQLRQQLLQCTQEAAHQLQAAGLPKAGAVSRAPVPDTLPGLIAELGAIDATQQTIRTMQVRADT